MIAPRLRLALFGAAATLLASLAILPVITGLRWLWLAALVVLGVVALGESLRRVRVPPAAVTLVQLLAAMYAVPALTVGTLGMNGALPTTTWLRVIVDRIELAGVDIQQNAAPVPQSPGLLLLVVGGVTLNAILVDAWVAGGITAWAGLPLLLLYAVPASSAAGTPTWPGFCLAAAGYLGLLAAERRERVRRWGRPMQQVGEVRREPLLFRVLAGGGSRLGLIALAVALTTAALVPVRPLTLLQGTGGGGTGTINAQNPIVDLKRDLVRPNNVEILRVRVDQGKVEYLRLVSLDAFDGESFQAAEREVPRSQRVTSDLPPAPGRAGPAQEAAVTQTYQVRVSPGYDSDWLPLPYAARKISIVGDWRFDRESLDVLTVGGTTRGTTYTVVSDVLTPTAAQLAAAPRAPQDTGTIKEPDPVSQELIRLAREVTADATTPFEQAAALQAWFRRDGGFRYSLDRAPGTSNNALESFLAERSGYCEQFAATMTLMARVLKIPARVAVGFRPGAPSVTGETVVRAHDAHAWPELYFTDVGWVRFEPTPAVQTGTAPNWTEVPAPAQVDPSTPTDPTPSAEASPEATTAPDQAGVDPTDTTTTSTPVPVGVWIGSAVVALLVIVSLPALLALALRRRRWRRAGEDVGRRAEAAWADLRFAVADAGLPWDTAQTLRVRAATVANMAGLDADYVARLDRLVVATERARYAAPGWSAGPGLGQLLATDARLLRHVLAAGTGWPRRWLARLWPAELTSALRGEPLGAGSPEAELSDRASIDA